MTPEEKMRAIAQWSRANVSSPPAMPQQMAPPQMPPQQPMPPSMGGGGMGGPSAPLTFDAMDQQRATQMQMYPPQQQQPMPLSAEQVQAALRSQSDDDIMKSAQPKPKFQQLKSKISGPIEVKDSEDPNIPGFQDEE